MSTARNNKSIDEDEDSDVELLSISSGDEDSSKPSNNAGKVSGGGGKGGNDDEDKNWTGEEPDRWKRVDEAELTRRVRAMREARVAPAAQKNEEKASGAAKKALTSLQSFPRGVECIDPLGIGIVDNKSLRLISDSFASSMPKPEKVDDKLREKLAYFSEKFDAKLFLTRIHQETSAADLEAGLKFLKTDLQGRNDQKRNLVKENFDCFVSCKSTIDDIQTKLKKIEEDPEGAGTAHLFNCIQGVYSLANRSMEPLFERQAQAEKIRSVQGMLQRFRTLFNLPSTIRTSISKGEYDHAVREYRKAKSIALPSHVGILKRVLEEVEKVMQEFKGTLVKSLENPKISLTDLENSVRLLLELEPESDPVWQYLNIQNQRIRGLLERCTLDHETWMEIVRNKMAKRDLSDSRWTQVHMGANHSPDGIGGTDVAVDFAGDELDALRGKYIHRLTTVVIHHIPAFWKVALSVFSGKFAKVTADSNVPASRIEEKVGGKQSGHSMGEVAGMVRSTVSLYESKVLETFHEFEESNILKAHMSDAIKEVAKACQALEVKDSAPSAVAASLSAMHSDLSKMYVFGICSWMKTSVEEISRDETWIPVSIMERNRSPYTITYLPLAFRSAIVSAMDQVNVMLQMLKTEVKTEEMLMQFQQIQESVKIAFLNSFLDFCGHLEHIGEEVSQNRSRDGSPRLPNGSQESSSDLLPGSIVDPNQQLLMVLSNIGYCKDELCNELYDKCKRVWSQSRSGEDGDKKDLLKTFSTLEEKILERYTFAKANWIRKAATNYLLDAGAQWGSAPPVKGVRDAAVELLHTFVAVHAEVYADAKPFLQRTLGILIEGVLDTLLGLFEEHQKSDLRLLDANGYTQLMLELEYFEAVLGSYITSSANGSLASLKSLLLEKAIESATELAPGTAASPDDLIARAHKCTLEILKVELVRTRINTACFTESIPRR